MQCWGGLLVPQVGVVFKHTSSALFLVGERHPKKETRLSGGATACLDGDFEFVVYPGDPGRLLFHLHGGGACWNWMTFLLGKCTKKSPMKPTGIFNVTNPNNPFYNWTLVDVPYCSGDVFSGATENFWIMPQQTASAWKSQAGYANVNSVLDWVKVQFAGAVPALRTTCSRSGAQFHS